MSIKLLALSLVIFIGWQQSALAATKSAEEPSLSWQEAKAQLKTEWITDQKCGEACARLGKYAQAKVAYQLALKQLRDGKISTSEVAVKTLMFDDISDCIENLALVQDMESAKELAADKLASARIVFGAHSIYALDAMQDELFLFNQTKDKVGISQKFWDYVKTARYMRAQGSGHTVDEAQSIRQQRLQRKLEGAMAKLKAPMS